jgi:hypothetical protein
VDKTLPRGICIDRYLGSSKLEVALIKLRVYPRMSAFPNLILTSFAV